MSANGAEPIIESASRADTGAFSTALSA